MEELEELEEPEELELPKEEAEEAEDEADADDEADDEVADEEIWSESLGDWTPEGVPEATAPLGPMIRIRGEPVEAAEFTVELPAVGEATRGPSIEVWFEPFSSLEDDEERTGAETGGGGGFAWVSLISYFAAEVGDFGFEFTTGLDESLFGDCGWGGSTRTATGISEEATEAEQPWK